ncbi:hypothetical protein A3Q56_03434 [Intoshia linei]|uniref:Rab-GAP TBC domain-containing protein n=1 Tax=Intoshia linei TaxID=1819745 RepID=A0A177B3H2_9BILA|nr:hypothetical protein A3Q56_03434 [Intoshia linei]
MKKKKPFKLKELGSFILDLTDSELNIEAILNISFSELINIEKLNSPLKLLSMDVSNEKLQFNTSLEKRDCDENGFIYACHYKKYNWDNPSSPNLKWHDFSIITKDFEDYRGEDRNNYQRNLKYTKILKKSKIDISNLVFDYGIPDTIRNEIWMLLLRIYPQYKYDEYNYTTLLKNGINKFSNLYHEIQKFSKKVWQSHKNYTENCKIVTNICIAYSVFKKVKHFNIYIINTAALLYIAIKDEKIAFYTFVAFMHHFKNSIDEYHTLNVVPETVREIGYEHYKNLKFLLTNEEFNDIVIKTMSTCILRSLFCFCPWMPFSFLIRLIDVLLIYGSAIVYVIALSILDNIIGNESNWSKLVQKCGSFTNSCYHVIAAILYNNYKNLLDANKVFSSLKKKNLNEIQKFVMSRNEYVSIAKVYSKPQNSFKNFICNNCISQFDCD